MQNRNNIILLTDSYKASHYKQYPPGTEYMSSYIESRGGEWDRTVFFGLQMFLKQYLSKPITQEDIDEAEAFWTAHGEPFNREDWQYILSKHGGWLPIQIEAVPEGTVVPTSNVLVQIANTDPKVPWLTSYMETVLLQAVWYPTTVATLSFMIKKHIYDALVKTCDDPDGAIGFKLHDFGFRGVSSIESAGIGGCAHLINFMGTDTVRGALYARWYYGENMAGFSIPAAEHSTITSWGGPEREVDAFRNMLNQFGGKGPLVAVVSDSYDIFNAVNKLWGTELKNMVEALGTKGTTLVVRPDSGDPTVVPVQVVEALMDKFGYTVNSKGFKVLPPYVRVIQGDGINEGSIKTIIANMMVRGLSVENIAFGMGGALLQGVNRDTLKFAMKASARFADGKWYDVFKDPVTDTGKRSKKGRLGLVYECGVGSCAYRTVPEQHAILTGGNLLKVVYQNGQLLKTHSFAEIRERATVGLKAMLVEEANRTVTTYAAE